MAHANDTGPAIESGRDAVSQNKTKSLDDPRLLTPTRFHTTAAQEVVTMAAQSMAVATMLATCSRDTPVTSVAS